MYFIFFIAILLLFFFSNQTTHAGGLSLSARNKFAGKVAAVEKGAVNDIVNIDTAFGTVSATISDSAVSELGLEAGKDAVAVVKATSVMVGVE